jgi:NADPH2:quinone reductase
VLSSSVNPIDVKTRSGLGFVAKNKQAGVFLPLGYDVYGIIERVGDAIVKSICGKYATGMVGFAKRPGSYSEFVIAELDELIILDMQQNEAIAGLNLAGLTAFQSLNVFSESALPLYINAPTGGVGHLAIQLAKLKGREVIAVSQRPAHPLLEKLAVKTIDYQSFFNRNVHAHLLDLVGGEIGRKMVSHLLSGGEVVTVPTISAQDIIDFGGSLGISVYGMVVESNKADLNKLVTAYRGGDLFVHVDKRFALKEVQKAQSYMEAGQYAGKIVICNTESYSA